MKPNTTQINPTCKRCNLHTIAHKKSICLRGKAAELPRGFEVPLVVFIDHPDFFADNAHRGFTLYTKQLLDWMFKRMSVDPTIIPYEYTIRCFPGKSLPTTKAGRSTCIEECASYRFATIRKLSPKAIVGLGQCTLEAFTGKTKLGDSEGREIPCWEPVVREICPTIWIGYSILSSPSEASRVFRTIYRAAESGGLQPKINPSIPPFQWRIIR